MIDEVFSCCTRMMSSLTRDIHRPLTFYHRIIYDYNFPDDDDDDDDDDGPVAGWCGGSGNLFHADLYSVN